jgi:hypothetical protein
MQTTKKPLNNPLSNKEIFRGTNYFDQLALTLPQQQAEDRILRDLHKGTLWINHVTSR